MLRVKVQAQNSPFLYEQRRSFKAIRWIALEDLDKDWSMVGPLDQQLWLPCHQNWTFCKDDVDLSFGIWFRSPRKSISENVLLINIAITRNTRPLVWSWHLTSMIMIFVINVIIVITTKITATGNLLLRNSGREFGNYSCLATNIMGSARSLFTT